MMILNASIAYQLTMRLYKLENFFVIYKWKQKINRIKTEVILTATPSYIENVQLWIQQNPLLVKGY